MVHPLPTELVNCIIDNLNPSDDQATLFNCALVGRAWAYASQRSIFQTIRLKVPNPDYIIDNADKSCVFDRVRIDYESGRHISRFVEAIYRLIVSLDEKPILASYVQCLELKNFDGVGKATPGYRINDACTSVAEVVNRLSRVRKLSMFCIEWEGLSSMLRTALTSMFSAPSMTEIAFHSFTIPTITDFASLLGHSVHLKALDLVNVMFSKELSANINHTGPSLKLDTLAFGGSEPTFLLWLQQRSCPLRFGNLRSLKTWVKSSGNYEMTAFVMQQAGRSLTKLELNLRLGSSVRLGSHRELAENLLGYVPNLQSIRLVEVLQKGSYTPVPWILSLFKPLLSSDLNHYPLQYITFRLRVDYSVAMEWDSWSAFDVLLQNPKFDSLMLVDIAMKIVGSSYVWKKMGQEDAEAAVKNLSRNLPFLKRSGKLKLHQIQVLSG